MQPTNQERLLQIREHGKVEPMPATKERLNALLRDWCLEDPDASGELLAVLEGIVEMLPDAPPAEAS